MATRAQQQLLQMLSKDTLRRLLEMHVKDAVNGKIPFAELREFVEVAERAFASMQARKEP